MTYDDTLTHGVAAGSNEPRDDGRTASGRFAPGNCANPNGRPRGSRNRATIAMEGLLEDKFEALTQIVVDKALEGDMAALRLCMTRLTPTRRDAPVQFDMPYVRSAADALNACAAVLKAVADGEVTPEEAGRVMALLKDYKALAEKGIWVPGDKAGSMSLDAYLNRFPGGNHECDEEYLRKQAADKAAWVEQLNAMLYGDDKDKDDEEEEEEDCEGDDCDE